MVSKKVLTIKRKTKKATSTADKKILRTTTPLYSIFVYKTNIRIRSIGIKKYFEDYENKMISDSATAVKTMIIWDALLLTFSSQDLYIKKFIRQD